MKNFLILFALLFSLITSAQQGDVYVQSYLKSDGTFIPDHYRTPKTETINDNYTTKGNVNPYNGRPGYIPREGNYKNTKTQTYSTNEYKIKTLKSKSFSTNNYNSYSNGYYNIQPKPVKRTRSKSTNAYYTY